MIAESMSNFTQLERRIVEAQVLRGVYEQAMDLYDGAQALALVHRVQERSAFAAGRAFAATASHHPDLDHFLTVLQLWQQGDAIIITDLQRRGNRASFRVTRCLYVESYRAMGMPEALLPLLSCARDEPFARGYSEHLRLERPETLASGCSACSFTFIWE